MSLRFPSEDVPDWVTPDTVVGFAFSSRVWLDVAWLVYFPVRDSDDDESDTTGCPVRVEEDDELPEEPIPSSVRVLDDVQKSAAVIGATVDWGPESVPDDSIGVLLDDSDALLDDQVNED